MFCSLAEVHDVIDEGNNCLQEHRSTSIPVLLAREPNPRYCAQSTVAPLALV